MRRLLLFLCLAALTSTGRAQLYINEISQGPSGTPGTKEYVEFVVTGPRTCTDSTRDLRGIIFDDNPGWYSTTGTGIGCYRFANVAAWSAIPLGSLILIYNAADKNVLITAADDPTDLNADGIYILPSDHASLQVGNLPSGASTTFDYSAVTSWTVPTVGSWTTAVGMGNIGDVFHIVAPSASTTTAIHSVGFGTLTGGIQTPNIYFSGNAVGTACHNTAGQPWLQSSWASGPVATIETPGAGNTLNNTAWIAAMKPSVLDAARMYVDSNSAFSGTGLSWTSPKQRLEEALAAANSTGCVSEIWVANGTYFPTFNSGTGARDSSFFITRNGVKVYGGFAGTETTLGARNIATNVTKLSGDIGTAVDSVDNSYHVVAFIAPPSGTADIDNTTTLDGFTVTQGYSINGTGTFTRGGQTYTRTNGGGIHVNGKGAGVACNPAVANCIITRNRAVQGAGFFGDATSAGEVEPTFTGCTISLNRVTSEGGGGKILGSGGAASAGLSMTGTTVTGNEAVANAGGIMVDAASPATANATITNCTLTGNRQTATASGTGGALWVQGAVAGSALSITGGSISNNTAYSGSAVFCAVLMTMTSVTVGSNVATSPTQAQSSTVRLVGAGSTVTSCAFSNNNATSGAGIEVTGGTHNIFTSTFNLDSVTFAGAGIRVNGSAIVNATKCRFQDNYNGTLGTIDVGAGTLAALSCIFHNNKAVSQAGAANVYIGQSATFTNCTFSANSTTGTSGAGGGALYVHNTATANINNSSFSNNAAVSIAAPNSNALLMEAGSTTNVRNTIIWGTATGQVVANGTVNYTASNVRGVAGTLNTDPLYFNPADPDGVDNIWATADDGLTLQATSPSRNTGSNAAVPAGLATDIVGVARIQQGTVDMGAYEAPASCFSGTVYVDSNVVASGDGQSWATAVKTLYEGLNLANFCPNINVVWVANGTYFPNTGASAVNARDSSLRILRNGIKVYGGFAGGETSLSARNIAANPAILSGDIGTPADSTDNVYHVMTVVSSAATPIIDTTTVVDGFTVTRGNCVGATGSFTVNGHTFNRQDGGGINLVGVVSGRACNPTLSRITFLRNSANYGGGLYAGGYGGGSSSPKIDSCVFTQNVAAIIGAGLGSYGTTRGNKPRLTGCSFADNTATSTATFQGGGGLAMRNSVASITGSTFTGNKAGCGSGMYSEFSRATVAGCTFTGNQVVGTSGTLWNYTGGGGSWANGAAAYHGVSDTSDYTGCVFTSNSGTYTGGLMLSASGSSIPSMMTLTDCQLTGNSGNFSSAIFTGLGTSNILTLTNTIVAANTGGRAAYFWDNTTATINQSVFADNGGNGILVRAGSSVTTNNSTVSNSAGNAFVLDAATSSATLNNTIVWGAPATVISNTGAGTIAYNNSLVKGVALTAPNLNINPVFVNPTDPDGADNTWRTIDDGLRLDTCSPALNAGDNSLVPAVITTDLTGAARIQVTTVDMGAYEHPYNFAGFPQVTLTATPQPACQGASVTVTATATNSGVPSYQFFINSTLVQTGSSATYTSSTFANNDTVWVRLTNTDCGYVDTSLRIVLTIIPAQLHVDASVAASGTGLSWASPLKTVDEALDVANSSTSCPATILVKQGTYFPMTSPTAVATSRDSSLRILRNSIKLYGGFGGTDTTFATRNPVLYPTILSGNINSLTDSSDNSHHVVTILGRPTAPIDTNTAVDGFTITGGVADIATNFTFSGVTIGRGNAGGIFNIGYSGGNSCSPLIENCTIRNNTAIFGAGLYNGGFGNGESSPVVRSCAFTSNVAMNNAGGMINNENSRPVISQCTFTNNYALNSGGAVWNRGTPTSNCAPQFSDCSFGGNTVGASGTGGALGFTGLIAGTAITNCTFTQNSANRGGGIHTGTDAKLTITASSFTGNAATEFGGGILTDGKLALAGSVFTGNTADWGGALHRGGTDTASAANCQFLNNTGGARGGAINIANGVNTLLNCVFGGNTAAAGSGGAIQIAGATTITTITNCVLANNAASATAGSGGGGLMLSSGATTVTNTTFSGNTTVSTAAVGSNAIRAVAPATLTLQNSIVWGAATQQVLGTVAFAHSDVRGVVPTATNLDIDPLFINPADPDGADNIWATLDDGLRLDTCSPALNAGDNALIPAGVTTDISGTTARILNTTVDMGAYEHPYSFVGFPDVTITASPAPPYCTGATITFTATPSNGGVASYQWFVNSASAQTGPGATFTTGTLANNDTVWVVLTNTGCGYRDTSNRIVVPVTGIPVLPGAITGNTTPCVGTSQGYTIAAVPGATSYTWNVPAGWTGTNTTTATPSFTTTVGALSGNVTVTANTTCGASTASILAVTVQEVPDTPTVISGPTAPCVGTPALYTTPLVAGVTYSWTLPGTGWTGSSSTATLNATVGTASGNVQVSASNACGASVAATLAVAPVTTPATPGTITGNAAPCAGTAQTYSVTAVAGATGYNWNVPAGWTITAGAGTPSITTTTSTTAGNIAVTASNICGTSVPASLAVAPTGTPAVPGTITGNAAPCVGTPQTYTTAAVVGAASYTWNVPGGSTGGWMGNATITTTPSFNTTVGTASGSLTVSANTSCGASAPSNLAVTVQQVPAYPSTIVGPAAPCAGSTQTYSVTPVAGVTYAWTLPGAGWNGSSPIATLSATVGTASGNIMVTATNVCGPSAATSLSVAPATVPAQPGTIGGNAAPCAGTSQTYTVAVVPGATSYNWLLPAGWATGGSTTNTITVTPNATAGSISVTAANICGPSTMASTLAVTPTGTSAAPGIISGDTSVCSNTQHTYSITPIAGATAYNWSTPAGWTGTSNTNTLNTTASATGGSVSVTVTNTCGTSAPSTLLVTVATPPAAPGAITGPATPCVGTPQNYGIAPVTGATSYAWTTPGIGWAGASPTPTLNATVGTAPGNVTVAAVNSCGTSAISILAVTPNNVPAQPGAITGTATPCIGASATYSIGAVANTTSYTWTVPTSWTGGTSTTTSVSTTPTAATGNVTVVANNVCGASLPQTMAVAPITTPAQPGTMTIPAQICQGVIGSYSVPNVAGATSYAWTLPTGWSGSSTSSTILATPNATSGTISVTASNTCGTSPARTAAVTVTPLPAQPSGISGPSPVCAGSVQPYMTTGAANATSYTWTLPSGWSGASTAGSILATVGNSGPISVTASNVCGTSAAATLQVTVNPLTATTASITATTPTTVCSGVPVSFTAVVTGGGTTPAYTWTRNGTVQGGVIGTTFTVSNPVSGDVIGFSMASSAVCPSPATAIAASITITVLSPVVPGININTQFSTAPIVCTGTQLNFTANIVGGGTAPVYQWRRNGTLVGTATPTYSATNWTSGETVYAVLTSNAQCATPATLNSNVVTVAVNPTVAPTVFITASPGTTFVHGQTVTFTANITGGGPAPTFEWMRNGQVIPGAFGPIYATSNLTGNDTISVRLTSGDPCASPTTAMADPLVTTMTPTAVATVAGATGVSLYPNPNEGNFTLAIQGGRSGLRTGIEVLNALGQVVYFREVIIERTDWTIPVELTDVASGIYLLRLRSEDGGIATLRFEVRK